MGESVTKAYSVKYGEYEATGAEIIPAVCSSSKRGEVWGVFLAVLLSVHFGEIGAIIV